MRRGEDEAMLRDAFFLRRGGDDPGPAGRMLVAWRGLDRSAPLDDDVVFHIAETLNHAQQASPKQSRHAEVIAQPIAGLGVNFVCRGTC